MTNKRRAVILATVLAATVATLARYDRQCIAATPIVRKDVRDLTADEIAKYREAVRRLKERGPERPTWASGTITLPNPASVARNGYSYQALLHTTDCPHGNWWFFPWHRVYLYYYEAMLREAVADFRPEVPLAIPYWNWTEQQEIPALLTENPSGNPLYDPRRFSFPLDDEDVGPDTMRRVADQVSSFEAFGSSRTCEKRALGTMSEFEGGPHGVVHVKVGGYTDPFDRSTWGAMRWPPTAAFDPIFWSHHANIDRIWNIWLSQMGHQSPSYNEPCAPGSSTTWGNLVFNEFVDPSGTSMSHTVQEYLESDEIRSVSYLAHTESIFASGSERKRLTIKAVVPKEDAMPLKLQFGKPLTLSIPIDASARARLEAAESAQPEPVVLRIEGVVPPKEAPDMRVRAFLNNPRADAKTSPKDPSYIGYFVFFDDSHSQEHRDQPHESIHAFNMTAVIRRLKGKLEADKPLTVTLVVVSINPKSESAPRNDTRSIAVKGASLQIGQ